ncbi:NTP transferase domain-containing protein, partial [Bdellovibrionota bacterium FG-1]
MRQTSKIAGIAGIIGVVLAGGRSTRMGQDKAQLMWGAERLLDRQIRVLAEALQCGRDSIWVSG